MFKDFKSRQEEQCEADKQEMAGALPQSQLLQVFPIGASTLYDEAANVHTNIQNAEIAVVQTRSRPDADTGYEQFNESRRREVARWNDLKDIFPVENWSEVNGTLYHRRRDLGVGGFGVVREYRTENNSLYAVKIISREPIMEGAMSAEDFVAQEVFINQKLWNHNGFCKIYHLYECPQFLYILMEYCYGSLYTRLTKFLKRNLSESEGRFVMSQLFDAVEYMHNKGIVHRDLKPENILCRRENSLIGICITDFDTAFQSKVEGTAGLKQLYSPIGTTATMAAEVIDKKLAMAHRTRLTEEAQERGEKPELSPMQDTFYDQKVDMWSLGVIMHFCLTSTYPYCGGCQKSDPETRIHKTMQENCTDCYGKRLKQMTRNVYQDKGDFQLLSSDAQDLITDLLNNHAVDRLSAPEALKHPWIVTGKCTETFRRGDRSRAPITQRAAPDRTSRNQPPMSRGHTTQGEKTPTNFPTRYY